MEENSSVERIMKQQKLRRKARRGEILLQRLYKFVRFIFILCFIYFTYRLCNAHYWFINSDVFKVPDSPFVEILGNNIVSREQILNTLADYEIPNKPIYRVNPREITRRIHRLSPIKKVYVRRFWLPVRFVIMVEEVTPAISVSPSENAPDIIAFALSGECIGREFLPFKNDMNTVKVLSYGTNGDDYADWDKDKIIQLYNIALKLEAYSGEDVEYLDLRNPQNAFAKIQSGRIRLGKLDSTLDTRIKRIKTTLPEIKKQNKPLDYLDLAWDESVYFKMKQ
ncbi:FtsQ-type POTRA domain-containing protein [bacterium]|nr:FtsQ-type POTRA domain-containing protein [bacterium]